MPSRGANQQAAEVDEAGIRARQVHLGAVERPIRTRCLLRLLDRLWFHLGAWRLEVARVRAALAAPPEHHHGLPSRLAVVRPVDP